MKSNFSTLRTNSDNSHGLTNSGLETVEKRTTSELPPTIPMGLTNSGLEIAEKLDEVDITTKVKRGDYFNQHKTLFINFRINHRISKVRKFKF